ncbi:hypothetical protein Fcan01_04195, partial [Folsomia candida]
MEFKAAKHSEFQSHSIRGNALSQRTDKAKNLFLLLFERLKRKESFCLKPFVQVTIRYRTMKLEWKKENIVQAEGGNLKSPTKICKVVKAPATYEDDADFFNPNRLTRVATTDIIKTPYCTNFTALVLERDEYETDDDDPKFYLDYAVPTTALYHFRGRTPAGRSQMNVFRTMFRLFVRTLRIVSAKLKAPATYEDDADFFTQTHPMKILRYLHFIPVRTPAGRTPMDAFRTIFRMSLRKLLDMYVYSKISRKFGEFFCKKVHKIEVDPVFGGGEHLENPGPVVDKPLIYTALWPFCPSIRSKHDGLRSAEALEHDGAMGLTSVTIFLGPCDAVTVTIVICYE